MIDSLSVIWLFMLTLACIACLASARMRQHREWLALGVTFIVVILLRFWPFVWCGIHPPESLACIPFLLLAGGAFFALLAACLFSEGSIPYPVIAIPGAVGVVLFLIFPTGQLFPISRWLLWIPSFLIAAYTILASSNRETGDLKSGKRLLALGVGLVGVIHPIPSIYSDLKSTVGSNGNILSFTDNIPSAMANSLACILILAGAWISFRQRESHKGFTDTRASIRGALLILAMAATFIGGWIWIDDSAGNFEDDRRKDLQKHASLVAAACGSSAFINQLSGTAADTNLPAYASIKERLSNIAKAGDKYRYAYLMILRNHEVVFLADSETKGSPNESKAGDIYHEADKDLYKAFYLDHPLTVGPYIDEWGTWISAFARVPQNEKEGFPVVVGIDKEASNWYAILDRYRQERFLDMLELAIFFVSLFVINYLESESRFRLQASEERLRLSIRGSNQVSWELDLETQQFTLDENRNAEALDLPMRFSAEDLLTYIHPEEAGMMSRAISDVTCGANESLESEFRIRQKDGNYLWVICHGQVNQPTSPKEPRKAAGIFLDISNRKKLEIDLARHRKEAQRLALVAENTTNGVVVTTPDGLLEWANKGFTEITGYTLEEAKGRKPGSLLQGNKTDPETVGRIRQALCEGHGFHETLLNYHKNGTAYWVEIECQPLHDELGAPSGFMAIQSDVTREKKHQLLLETLGEVSQLLLNTQLDSPASWRALAATLGKKIGVDRVCISRYRFDAEGVFEKSEVFSEWDSEKGTSSHGDGHSIGECSIIASGQPPHWISNFLEGRHVLEYGDEITFPMLKKLGTLSFLGIPLTVEGKLWGTISFHDKSLIHRWDVEEITLLETLVSLISSRLDIQQSEQALVAARDAAESASRAKSTFLATMSHEIRTPLNAVIGISSLLLETPLASQQRDYAHTISSSGEILLELINDILDYSKIEAGKIDLENLPFDLTDVLVEPLEIMARVAAEKNIDLAYSADPAIPPIVVGDRMRLKQVLLNLVSNAVKFTEEGSVTIKAEAMGSSLVGITVQDTGMGISEDVQQKLFAPFMQADSSVTRKFGGTGLGLAISKRLVELMGGEISFSSIPGQGSSFRLELPLPAGHTDSKIPPLLDASLIGKRVLVVDDNLTNRNFLRDQLHAWGLATSEVATAREALALLGTKHDFHLALLDYEMPDLDGLELAKAIREMPSALHLPLVLLSSVIERIPTEDAHLFEGAITKPLRIGKLLETVVSALSKDRKETGVWDTSATPTMKVRVLVAEDNITNQKVIRMMLSRFGITPTLVDNGLMALEAVKMNPFDLVLLDVQMPVMDGLEAVRRMREYFKTGRRPEIIALTANAFREDREACIAAGMDGYLVKPITLDRLRAVIEKASLSTTKSS